MIDSVGMVIHLKLLAKEHSCSSDRVRVSKIRIKD